ncbi:hypothetical protein BWD42_19940 [Sphingobacterium sp. CZ-UAM]|uniref:helix-turn-helix domain-containing protein n=1 Tax=Sphingobacterium sp. CZ-UAM TaxID=1933868 RepID=UPI000985D8E6|nr:helix-turn-helix transcriptional regulator [Sphingobacterium sp. CZ-UAM]OOG16513.1 hypothetical protein BWD42_19940 [Sphingobacterium sp. CZ-UAM]
MESQTVNQLIKQSRKRRGLTQQDLANQAGLSLRTVQRIEKGTEEISGFSLRQISQVLEIPLEQLIMPNVNQISIDNNQSGSIKALYLASLTFLVNPLLGLLVPAIMGYTKQNKDAQYSKHLKKNHHTCNRSFISRRLYRLYSCSRFFKNWVAFIFKLHL